ncbi:hypothetical protein AADZ86_07180 [Colwelliaceae bacterium BS250]
MKSHEAKAIWKNLQQNLVIAQDKINLKFKRTQEYPTFLKFLKSNIDVLNIVNLKLMDSKFGHYGKLIQTQLIIPENGRLYLETAYYPLSKKYFGKKRLSISNKFEYSKHYMERLIERKNITSILDIKNELVDSLEKLGNSNFTQQIGGLDLSTAFIILHKGSVSFCDLEIDEDQTAMAVMKTIITDKELSNNKKEMIDYILNATKSDSCFLATYDIPETFVEADNVIEDTKKRTNGIAISWEEQEIRKMMGNGSFNSEKKALKAFVSYLEAYDTDSAKCKY